MKKAMAHHLTGLILIIGCCCIAFSAARATEPSQEPVRGRSAGCGILHVGTGSFMPEEIRVLEQDRTYYLRIPSTYDPNRAYPIIFRWHGFSGNGLSGGLGIEFSSGNDAIIVGADGLNMHWNDSSDSTELLLDASYPDLLFSTDPVNLLFFDRMLDTLAKQYCIDRDRIFSYGFSSGAGFTNLLACERGEVLRASAAIAGWPRGGNCKGKVAAWFLHDVDDKVVAIDEGWSARDRALSMNGCSTSSVREGESCIRYQGCEVVPVIWCETKGFGHNIRSDFAPERVWKFFLNFR